MTVRRVEFIGFAVMGPRMRAAQSYKPEEWGPSWTATVEGPHLLFEGEGRRIEVPRARAIVYYEQPAAKEPEAQPAGKSQTIAERTKR